MEDGRNVQQINGYYNNGYHNNGFGVFPKVQAEQWETAAKAREAIRYMAAQGLRLQTEKRSGEPREIVLSAFHDNRFGYQPIGSAFFEAA